MILGLACWLLFAYFKNESRVYSGVLTCACEKLGLPDTQLDLLKRDGDLQNT